MYIYNLFFFLKWGNSKVLLLVFSVIAHLAGLITGCAVLVARKFLARQSHLSEFLHVGIICIVIVVWAPIGAVNGALARLRPLVQVVQRHVSLQCTYNLLFRIIYIELKAVYVLIQPFIAYLKHVVLHVLI